MKSSKILLILASAALLASCGGTSSSTTTISGESTSSEVSSSSEESSTSVAPSYEAIDAATGKAALKTSVGKTVDHDAVALHGKLTAEGQYDGIAEAGMSSSVPYVDRGTAELSGAYDIDVAVSGLKGEEGVRGILGAANIKGSHNLEAKTEGETVFQNAMNVDSSFYVKEGSEYLNLDQQFHDFLVMTAGYPYEDLKVKAIDVMPDVPGPLLSQDMTEQVLAGFDQIIAYGEQLFPNKIAYSSNGTDYKVALPLDHDCVITILTLAAGQEMATLYADAVKLIDIRDLGVEIGFGEEGLNGIAITVDGALDKTVGELAPAAQASELPTEIASQKIDLDVKVGLSFDIAYGEEVTLPTDLDTYVEATAPVKPATSSTSDRLFPELYQAILGFEDPEYTKLDVYVPDESDEPVFAYSYNANSPMWEYVASDFQFMLNTGTYPLIEKSVRSGMDVEVSIDKTAIVIELHNEGKDDKGAFQGTNILSYDPVTGYVQAAETSYLYETGENEVTNYSFVWGFVD